MMKKLMIFPIIFLLSITAVSAQWLPQPISGTIKTLPINAADSLSVFARNLRTNDEIDASRAGNVFLIEAANFQYGYAPGDTIRVIIRECQEESVCVQDVQVYGEPVHINFDLTSLLIECPVCEECPEDTTPYEECDSCCPDCPDIVSCEEQGYILPEDCPKPEPCPDCPEYGIFEVVITVIVGLIAGGGVGITIGKYKTTGKLFLRVNRHKHPTHKTKSLRKLHSIYTIHEVEPHPKGEKNPAYDEGGKYIGG